MGDQLARYDRWKRELRGAATLLEHWNAGKTTRILKKTGRYYAEVESDLGVTPQVYDVTLIQRDELAQYFDHPERA